MYVSESIREHTSAHIKGGGSMPKKWTTQSNSFSQQSTKNLPVKCSLKYPLNNIYRLKSH